MSATRKSGSTNGCWTCKLRRKKCDARRPTCEICDHLGIACTYGTKPNWMNTGPQQRQMIERLKNDIKRKAEYRREEVNTSRVSNHLLSFGSMDNAVFDNQALAPPSDPSAPYEPTPFPLHADGRQQHYCLSGVEQTPAIETDFIMKYLDYVFPALFPFYRPGFFETGRSWLLLLLGKSKTAYHSAVSLSCFFFTIAFTTAGIGEEYAECKRLRWKEVEQQTNKCYDSIRKDMLALDLNSQGAPAEKVQSMVSVIQVLIFEMALGKSTPCNSHIAAAFALFEEIMSCSGQSHQNQDRSKLTTVLLEIGKPSWTNPGNTGHIWSPEQAGFRFCAGLLVFIDVMASTALQETPRLLSYHPEILAQIDEGTPVVTDAEVQLSTIVGCRNWVISSIAKISALASWKQQQSEANSLSIMELVNRASSIANDVTNGIVGLQNCPISTSASSPDHCTPFDMHPSPSSFSTSTMIWAHAAQLYLSVVVSGWQLSNADVRANVTQIIERLQDVPAYQLRALAWPVCVAGCLALESEESSFLTLLSNQGKICTAGALDDTLQILEHVWRTRMTLHASTWNLASCFTIFGSPVLLV